MDDIVEELVLLQSGAQWACGATAKTLGQAADEITRLRSVLEKIVAMRPPIPEDAEGCGPNWEQYIYTRTWALFAASLQDTARAALGGER